MEIGLSAWLEWFMFIMGILLSVFSIACLAIGAFVARCRPGYNYGQPYFNEWYSDRFCGYVLCLLGVVCLAGGMTLLLIV